jgi:hypothetical protein
VKRIGLAALGVLVVTGGVWWLERAVPPDPVPVVTPSADEGRGLTPPVLLAADRVGPKVMLRWRSVPESLAFHLWRAVGPGGKFEVIFTGRDTFFTDRDGILPGQRYCYRLTFSDPEFDESGFSEQLCVNGIPDSR